MARARNIKPSIMDNEDLAELDPLARLLFIYLWMLADREGRVEDRPKRIAAQALAYDRTADVSKLLSDLAFGGFIDRYVADGVAVIQITKFAKHQTPHIRESASTLPKKESGTTKAVPRSDLGDAETSPRSPDTGYLNPDTGYLNPDTGYLNPSSPVPAPETVTESEVIDDDEKPKDPAQWLAVFAEQHGVDVDHRSFHDRKKFWPLAQAWTNAGVTVGQMRQACTKAHAEATESIAWLPAYADRVLASIQRAKVAPNPPRQQQSFKERDDAIGKARWEQMTGRVHPDNMAANVIDATPQFSRISQ